MTGKGRVLRTVVRDCLYVNWAFPREWLPDPPEPLTYEQHVSGAQRFVLGSALLFRHEHLHLIGLPFLSLSYPQFHLRLYIRDHEGVPGVLFQRVLVPGWVVPSARWVAHQPALAAHFRYPEIAADPAEGDEWSWQVEQRDSVLGLRAQVGTPSTSAELDLGGWQRTVDYVRQRSRGYVAGSAGLQPVATSQHPASTWPMQVTIDDASLLRSCLGFDSETPYPQPHSAWLCPEVPFEFEISTAGVETSLKRSSPPIAADPAMFRGPRAAPRRVAA